MIRKFETGDYTCAAAVNAASSKAVYMIYPRVDVFGDEWLDDMSSKYGVTIVVVFVPLGRWNDDLTPWPEPPEAKGCPPFAGKACDFYTELTQKIIPEAEKNLALEHISGRDLAGVSLAGLFTLWQWMQYGTFDSVACLSGSFWYDGFIEWFERRTIPQKKGKAYFLLGTEEPRAKIKAYRTVGVSTEAIVKRLTSDGIECRFDWVPGNHFADPLPRAEKALEYLSKN